MAQPPFWLKVSKKYVIENFDSLLDYIARYEYTSNGDPEHADFLDTCRCLDEVAAEIAEAVTAGAMWQVPAIPGTDPNKALRIIAASALAQKKIGNDDYRSINALIMLLTAMDLVPGHTLKSRFIDLTVGCMGLRPVSRFGYSFANLAADHFAPRSFSALLASTKLADSPRFTLCRLDGHGSLDIRDGQAILAVMNIEDATKPRTRVRRTLTYDDTIALLDTETKKPSDVNDIIEYGLLLGGRMDGIRPAAPRQPRALVPGMRTTARIVHTQGIKIVVRTADSSFQTLEGKLWLDPRVYLIPREFLLRHLEPGKFINVEVTADPEHPFRLDSEVLREFIIRYAEHGSPEEFAVYVSDFKNGIGSRWLSESGLFVNIVGDKADVIDDDELDHLKVLINIKNCQIDAKGNIVVNGAFAKYGDTTEPIESRGEFENQAYNAFCEDFVFYQQPDESDTTFMRMETVHTIAPAEADLLGRLLTALADDTENSSDRRASLLCLAIAAMKIAGRDDNAAIVRHHLEYLRQIVRFAQGASSISLRLKADPPLDTVSSENMLDNVISELIRYRETLTTFAPSALRSHGVDDSTLGNLKQLVDASNILNGRIDLSEINRIKKAIASLLGVNDVYKDILGDLPYFGVETDTMEFKISCALPPRDRQVPSERENIETQRWNILKGVCAFLNSRLGGDLLIGVSDDGYAKPSGIADDMNVLYRNGFITERNPDRVRTYLKNAIDQAFVSGDGSVAGAAVTADCVRISIEKPTDHTEILRIHIEPYPWDVVKFASSARPDWLKDVYCRTSGASTPMNSEGIRNLKLRKLHALDRDDLKTAHLLQAIDEKRVVILKNYASRSSGRVDRRVEPSRLLHNMQSLQAYDLQKKTMRLFRLSRVEDVVLTPEKWSNTRKHKDLPVDIFGMMETPDVPVENVTLKISDYALSLLREEHPLDNDPTHTIAPNTDSDSDAYPWLLTLTTCNPAGIGRFVLGLPREVKTIAGDTLLAYIDAQRSR